jgi:hypothetical protein
MAKHNLDLTIVNDGALYEKRKPIAFEFIATGNRKAFYTAMKNEVVNPSVIQARKEFGDKYSLKDIKEITADVMQNDKEMVIDLIRDAYKDNKRIQAYGRKWWDKINGNTYQSARIWIAGFEVYIQADCCYGDHWRYNCYDWLTANGFIEKQERKNGFEPRDFNLIDFHGIVECKKAAL